MTDRTIVYDGALPLAADLLSTSKFAMIGDAMLAMATLGNSGSNPSTVVAGLSCTPTAPATLNVQVGPGAIFSVDTVDASAYGDLGSDANQIFKMGIRIATNTLAITPPTTTGFSQVFLVQAILSDVDGGDTVLSYYNAANPDIPLSGPANAGTSQKTTRTCVCTIALKAGVAAATGTQTNPAPDAGYTALYYVTVANGATQITSGNIVQAAGGYAPFVNTGLPYIPSKAQSGVWTYAQDTGSINQVVVTLAPAPTAYNAGMRLNVKMANAPTAACSINVNGLGSKSIAKSGGTAIVGGEWQAGDIVGLIYDGTNFQLNSVPVSGGLVFLKASQTYYVNTTGSDSNDGLSATNLGGGRGPFQTIQRAITACQQFNLNGFNITVNVAAGAYTGPVNLPNINGSGTITLNGNVASPQSQTISSSTGSAVVVSGSVYNIQGFQMSVSATSGGDPGDGIHANANGIVNVTTCSFGSCVNAHMGGSGQININGTINSNGSSGHQHLQATVGGRITLNPTSPPTININAALTLSGAFAQSDNLGVIYGTYSSITGAGNVTGKKYDSSTNGIVNTLGAGVNYWPGTAAGTTASGGQYQ